jgi:hypothetical protein
MPVMPLSRLTRRHVPAQRPWFVPISVFAFVYKTHGRLLDRAVAASLALPVIILACNGRGGAGRPRTARGPGRIGCSVTTQC